MSLETNHAQYVKHINRYPKITLKEEADLVAAARKGNKEARERLVAASMRKAFDSLEKAGVPIDMDMVQEANLAMLQAVDSFLKGNAAPMSLRPMVYQAVQRKVVRVEKARNCAFCLRNEPDNRSSVSSVDVYDVVVYEEETGENDQSPWDYSIPQTEETAMDDMLAEALDTVMQGLTPRESLIIELSFGLKGKCPMDLQEIAGMLNSTYGHVRMLQSRALRKLRNPLRARILKDFID